MLTISAPEPNMNLWQKQEKKHLNDGFGSTWASKVGGNEKSLTLWESHRGLQMFEGAGGPVGSSLTDASEESDGTSQPEGSLFLSLASLTFVKQHSVPGYADNEPARHWWYWCLGGRRAWRPLGNHRIGCFVVVVGSAKGLKKTASFWNTGRSLLTGAKPAS